MSRTFANYVVSGAGIGRLNGTYAEQSTDTFFFGQHSLKKGGDGKWKIRDDVSGFDVYVTTDTPATPDLGTWVKGQNGIDPPPTMTAIQVPANPDILVSGAGSNVVNGTYEHIAFEDGKPIYEKFVEDCKIMYIVDMQSWFILVPYTHPEYGNTEYPYYQEKQSESGSPATPDLVAEWEIFTIEGMPTVGVNPPPNVTEYTPPAHDIAVDPLTAQANLTQPTLRQTHKLSASPLGATAGITEPTLSQVHVLTVEPLVASANITQPTLTQTHVIDIEPLWAQIELSDLTLEQYIRTPTPECRRLTIHAEDRTLTIPREDRRLTIKCCE